MHYGLFMIQTDRSMAPAVLAAEGENRGFESIFFAEHTHVPANRITPYPAGGDLPDEYHRILDPFVALATAAQATTRIRLGTGVCLVAQHDPIVLAKTVATLDVLSGGRVILGLGVGWNREEAANHGVDPRARRAVAREKTLAMRTLWSQDEASFEGEFVQFEPSLSWPKPIQRPWPPLLLGGRGPQTLQAVVDYGDGWMPIGGANLRARLAELRCMAEAAGRDPDTIGVTVFGVLPDPEKLDRYAALGVERVVFNLPSGDADRVRRAIDRAVAAVDQRTGTA